MTREIGEISELEKMLDIFQNIRDHEMGLNPPRTQNNGNHNQTRGHHVYIEMRGERIIVETNIGHVRGVNSKILLNAYSVIDVNRRGTVGGTEHYHNTPIPISEERMATTERRGVAGISPVTEVGTCRVVQQLNQETREDNGGRDPAIVTK